MPELLLLLGPVFRVSFPRFPDTCCFFDTFLELPTADLPLLLGGIKLSPGVAIVNSPVLPSLFATKD